jgi:hypothetical protein
MEEIFVPLKLTIFQFTSKCDTYPFCDFLSLFFFSEFFKAHFLTLKKRTIQKVLNFEGKNIS